MRGEPMRDRVERALRREGECGTGTIARALGKTAASVQAVLVRGIDEGWCRLVRKDGQHGVYALVKRGERAA